MPRTREYRSTYGALALIASALNGGSSAFTILRPQRCMVSRIGSSSNDNGSNDGDTFFFNDFSDTNDNFGGSSSSDRNMSSLLSRMSEVKGAEAAYDAKLARNWRRGNWSVRGFALDKSSGTEMNMEDRPIHVSVVAAPTLSDCIDSLLQDSLSPEDYAVAVGRTDGSVFIIQLGNQYLTNFVAVPKLIADQDAGKNNNTTGMVARVEKEWMSADQLKDRLNDDQQHMAGSDGKVSQNQSSFQIKYQFLASEQGEAINKLVFIDSFEDKDCDGIICAAPGSSGEISMTNLRYSSGDSTTEMQSSILSGVHHNEIISLQSMILHPNGNDADVQNILFSASRDGTFALWNLDGNGELITSCQCTDALAGGALTCADVFNPSSWDDDFRDNSQVGNDVIFLGTSNGYVVGFRVMDLLATAIVSSECPSPNLCFRAHGMDSGKGESVTAIKCGGDGTIVSSARLRATDESQDGSKGLNPRPSSFILLTGGEDGSVKQWEILSQKTSSSIRMEHWPRLSSQRMKRRAHIFSPSHDGPVTCIAQQSRHDASKFITSGQDGSVCVWSASSGKELFRMEGFSSVSSLACLGRELLVTNGMNEYVCVHDFGIAEDAASNGYELEW